MTPEEASTSKLQSVLLRALGIDPQVDVDVIEDRLLEGDILLLCSDGLTRELSDTQIAAVLKESSHAESCGAARASGKSRREAETTSR